VAETAARDRDEPGTGVRPFLVASAVSVTAGLFALVYATVRANEVGSVLEGLRRLPTPPDILDALTRGYSAALLGGALFAIAGIVVAIALIRLDTSQLEVASAAPPTA
jgi:hypothetical protein